MGVSSAVVPVIRKDAMVVADTSSLLVAGTRLLGALSECTLVIPAIVVSELESKRTDPLIGFLAREWIRLLEHCRTTCGVALRGGVAVPDSDRVWIRVEPNHTSQQVLPEWLRDGSHDSTVLAVAANLRKELEGGGVTPPAAHTVSQVVLMSNDSPMRLHATLELDGLEAIEFAASQARKVEPFTGRVSLTMSASDFDQLGTARAGALPDMFRTLVGDGCPANCLVDVRAPGSQVTAATYLVGHDRAEDVSHLSWHAKAAGVHARSLEQYVALTYLLAAPDDVSVVSLGGPAGTGKTLLSVAAGIHGVNAGVYRHCVVFKSLHEVGRGQEMGFLPGSVDDKIEPWGGSVRDALDTIAAIRCRSGRVLHGPAGDAVSVNAREMSSQVEVSPISYLRGRSMPDTFMVIEEAQNFSATELLTVLTRAGEGSKVVLTFDDTQVDNQFLPRGADAEVWSVVDAMKGLPMFAHVTLTEVERSELAKSASQVLETLLSR